MGSVEPSLDDPRAESSSECLDLDMIGGTHSETPQQCARCLARHSDPALSHGLPGVARRAVDRLTLDQRATWIKNLMGGTFSVVFKDEERRVAQIFKSCPASERPLLYRMIEGHAWNGDYVEGYFTADDDLYNSLEGAELSQVRDLINEGM